MRREILEANVFGLSRWDRNLDRQGEPSTTASPPTPAPFARAIRPLTLERQRAMLRQAMKTTLLCELFRAWDAAGLRYLVIGDYAVIAHGHLRATHDLDLMVDLTGDQPLRLVEVLRAQGFAPRAPVALAAFADPAARRHWVQTLQAEVFSLRRERPDGLPDEIDILLDPPFAFAEAHAAALRQVLPGGLVVPFVDRDRLIAMKRRAGRPKDLDDIAALEGQVR